MTKYVVYWCNRVQVGHNDGSSNFLNTVFMWHVNKLSTKKFFAKSPMRNKLRKGRAPVLRQLHLVLLVLL